jgi:hypothetical protein
MNLDVWYTLRKPCPDGLFYPEHMSQIRPAVRVRGWLCLAVLPADGLYARVSAPIYDTRCKNFVYPVLLQETL